MKRLFQSFAFITSLILWSCSSFYDVDQIKEVNPNSEYSTKNDEIITKAGIAYDLFYPSHSKDDICFSNDILCAINHNSRGETPDTLLYVINAEDDKGFVMLGAPLEKGIILAVSNNGSITSLENNEKSHV